MRAFHVTNLVRLAIVLCAAVALTPATATAGGHRHRACADGPAGVNPATAATDPSLGPFPYPPGEPWCYTFPIWAVYQFPAVIANQPGSEVGWLQPNPAAGLLGGRPFLYHP